MNQPRPEPADTSGAPFRYPHEVGEPPTPQAAPPPPYDQFFDPVWRQLIDLPPVSDGILSRTMKGVQLKVLPAAASTVENLREFGPRKLRPEFQPPAGTQYVAFPMESKCCDVIRARFQVAPYVIDLAFAKRLVSVRVVGAVRKPGESALETANRMLRVLVDEQSQPPTPFHLLQINAADGTDARAPAYGCQDLTHERFSTETPTWPDYLSWWLRPEEFGFISFSRFEKRTQGFESPLAEGNTYWFTRDPNASQHKGRKSGLPRR